MTSKELPGWIRAPLILGFCGWILWREWRTPARREVESKVVRDVRNLAIAGLAGATVQLAEVPVALRLSRWAEQGHWGLLKWLDLPVWLEAALAVLALDYTLYLWHLLTHRVPLLWRFHQPHHVDLDMDASTALRFHFGEIGLSVGWRAVQIAVIGVSPLAFSIWQTGLFVSIVFHHSNVRLSPATERRLSRWLVTPRMHEIHHSNIADEADSNWSSGLSIWDRLHGTQRLDVPREGITIGVPAYAEPGDVTLGRALTMPFVGQRPSWRTPDGRWLLSRGSTADSGPATPVTP
jgi:sterol desaturase/sphingolipid hydroxylase (fatty acid hydroxylase superfamily)